MKAKIEAVLTAVVAAAIVAMAVVVVHREFFGESEDPGSNPAPAMVKNWAALKAAGTSEYKAGRPITILEFGDLQCPACRSYQPILEHVERRFRPQVDIVFVHFPMPYHKAALAAARAAECANDQGKFGAFVSNVYNRQDSLLVRPLRRYAEDIRLNLERFEKCIADSSMSSRRVDVGMAAATASGINATPTIIVEGWQFQFAPAEKYLSRFIKELEEGHVKAPRT